jgi:hypothetical protein
MAINIWHGDEATQAQIATAVIDTVDGTDNIFTVTSGGHTVSVESVTNPGITATALLVELQAATDPRFTEMDWTNPSGGNITATVKAENAGVPLDVQLSVSGVGSGSVTDFIDDVPNEGPNNWATGENWSLGAIPENGDDVVIEHNAVPILYGLDQSSVTLDSLTIKSTYTGTIGLPLTNPNGYTEHRPRYINIGSTVNTINSSGSGRINIDLAAAAAAVTINGSGTPAVAGIPPILLLGSNAGNTLNLNKGSVGIAFHGDETAVFATIAMEFVNTQASDATLVCGSGCTLTTITKSGGNATVNSNLTTVTQTAGTMTIGGTATVTTAYIQSGSCFYTSSGTMTSAVIASGGVLDFRRNGNARTVTNTFVYAGGAILDPSQTVTFTGGFTPVDCSLTDVTLDLGTDTTLGINPP